VCVCVRERGRGGEKEKFFVFGTYMQNVAHMDGRTKSKSCRDREAGGKRGDGNGGGRARRLYQVVFRSMQEDF
jgi:hypothetical protein